MKSSKELFEKLSSDKDFYDEFNAALIAKREAGAETYYETLIPTAHDYGYEVTKEEVDAILEKYSDELSEEELGKVSGGTSCVTGFLAISVTKIVSTIMNTIYSNV